MPHRITPFRWFEKGAERAINHCARIVGEAPIAEGTVRQTSPRDIGKESSARPRPLLPRLVTARFASWRHLLLSA